jgi:hypothetical protein
MTTKKTAKSAAPTATLVAEASLGSAIAAGFLIVFGLQIVAVFA